MAALDEQASKNAFHGVLRVWIYPEIDRRLKNGQLTDDFILTKAQVLLSPVKRNPEVRLNEEVKARITATFKGKHKEPGEPVFESELADQISDIELTDNDDPNSGHVTMLLFKGRWVFHFDFRYNKPEAKKRYDAANEFYEIAKICYDKQYWRPFIDNLFSSAELLVTSQLLVLSLLRKTTHNSIQTEYNSFINLGNAKIQHKELFNKLRGLRDPGRYFNQQFMITQEEGKEMLQVVEDIFNFTKSVIT
jgi:hypothetical protein